jgi:2,4-diketo-3-deoxy-L-fuconate hydrolase
VRLTAYREGGEAHMAVVIGGRAEPLGPVEDFYADVAGSLGRAGQVTEGSMALHDLTLAPPVPPTAKVLCVGLNYRAHAAEGGREVPSHPNIFARWASTLVADGDDVPLPSAEPGLDFEGELVVVVGSPLRGADPAAAAPAILGYACGNDITARGFQHRTPQWALGKNPDRSGPMSHLVTADELGGPDDRSRRSIVTRLNGAEMQRSSHGMMVFPPEEIMAYASGCLTLQPGDVIFTGTPEGVGIRRNPPLLMGPGDRVEVEIEGIGVLTNRIVAAPA